jgi:hypothetical protein
MGRRAEHSSSLIITDWCVFLSFLCSPVQVRVLRLAVHLITLLFLIFFFLLRFLITSSKEPLPCGIIERILPGICTETLRGWTGVPNGFPGCLLADCLPSEPKNSVRVSHKCLRYVLSLARIFSSALSRFPIPVGTPEWVLKTFGRNYRPVSAQVGRFL